MSRKQHTLVNAVRNVSRGQVYKGPGRRSRVYRSGNIDHVILKVKVMYSCLGVPVEKWIKVGESCWRACLETKHSGSYKFQLICEGDFCKPCREGRPFCVSHLSPRDSRLSVWWCVRRLSFSQAFKILPNERTQQETYELLAQYSFYFVNIGQKSITW